MPRLRLLPEVTVVENEQIAARVLQYLMLRGGPIAIDTETNGLNKMRSQVLCWSMATDVDRYFITRELLLFFEPLFARADIDWYLANAKFDMHMLKNMGVVLAGKMHDIVVMDAMDDDTRAHGLKQQAFIAYDVRWGDFKDLFLNPEHVSAELGLEKSSFTQFKRMGVGEKLLFVYSQNPHIVWDYASCDAFFTYMRAVDLESSLTATPLVTQMAEGLDTLYDYFALIEVPFTKSLWRMERNGVPVDLDRVAKLDGPMRDGIRGYEYDIKKLVSPTFNPGSDAELRELLFGKPSAGGYGLSPVAYTSSEKNPVAAVGEKDLKALQNRVKEQKVYDLIEHILSYRHLKKLHGTFVEGIRDLIGPDGNIHCSLNQTGARTGRLSSSDPNMQQIPIRNDEFHIRSMFCAPSGEKLIDCDYPQIQPRIAAVLAGEEKMLEAFRNGWDIHSANAANMFRYHDKDAELGRIEQAKAHKELREKLGRPLTALEKKLLTYRDRAKTVGLGVLFGEGPTKMGHQLRIATEEASMLIKNFFDTYPNLKKLIDDTHRECHLNEFAYTMLGRMRRLHQINNEYNFGKTMGERRAGFNHKIQGTEVEFQKLAILQLDASKEWNELGGKLRLPVHDELLSSAPIDTVKEAFEVKCRIMGRPLRWGPIDLEFPVSVYPDGGYGDNWADIH